MLSVLKIKNLALVDDLTWELGQGLIGVTGETGAGKSIIVGAIKLALGDRADRSLIRAGTDGCAVEAVFDLANGEAINARLADCGLEPCEDQQLVIKRVIGSTGSNKQFVNCSPATLQALKALGELLVDLHGPHEHHSLVSQDRQLDMLDAFAQVETERASYAAAYRQWRSVAKELDELRKAEATTEQEIDLLRHQVQEIAAADPKTAEIGPLEQRYQMASNASHLRALAHRILGKLSDGDSNILGHLGEISRLIRDLEHTDPGSSELTREFDSAQVILEEMADSLRRYAEDVEVDPAKFAEMEDRVNTLETLKRKYGRTIDEVLAFRERAEKKLARIEGRGDEIARLESELQTSLKATQVTGLALSQKRRSAAPRLAKKIATHLADLGFKKAKIEIAFLPGKEPESRGLESIDFIFAPNPGEPAKPLRLIASSGEMARVMLAVKCALAKQDDIPLLVFDEIDANVGGEIASAVGAKMAELGQDHQVIAITHLPQVAALAQHHYLVEKEFSGSRTRSQLREVTEHERVAELARMLGGDAKSATAHARNLLAKT